MEFVYNVPTVFVPLICTASLIWSSWVTEFHVPMSDCLCKYFDSEVEVSVMFPLTFKDLPALNIVFYTLMNQQPFISWISYCNPTSLIRIIITFTSSVFISMETRFAINAFHICLYSDEFEFTSKLNLLLDDHVKNMLFYVLA